jgi:DNA-binding GntR family transcriptional regulator
MRASAETASLAAEAYNVVRQRIARGELVLGQPVSRRRLAAELGMSFLPVTEALLRLEFEGLLESRPRAGTRVRIPLPQDVEGNYIVRQALETQAAILCSRTICHADIRNWSAKFSMAIHGRIADAVREHLAVGKRHTLELLEPYFWLHSAGSARFSRAARPPKPS